RETTNVGDKSQKLIRINYQDFDNKVLSPLIRRTPPVADRFKQSLVEITKSKYQNIYPVK
ncbi:MAG: hypothetical protein KAU83_03745, partial [Bacteroidales bacterium]|nr:hypothetical protein [Bacteroidales bacterium]